MGIRLNKVTKECNVGLQTAVEFLQKKGFTDIEANPNTKISEEQYEMLVAAFKTDQGLRKDAELISRRQNKEKKETISIAEEEVTPAQPAAAAPKGPKVVGHIDLDALNRPARKATEAPKAENAHEENTTPETPEVIKEEMTNKPTESEKTIGTEENGVFRLNTPAGGAPQLKVKGHIDLSALNQSTRPKK